MNGLHPGTRQTVLVNVLISEITKIKLNCILKGRIKERFKRRIRIHIKQIVDRIGGCRRSKDKIRRVARKHPVQGQKSNR